MNEKLQYAVKQVSSAADKAAKGAGRLAKKGKEALDCKTLQKELERAQRLLGAAAYEALRAGLPVEEEPAAKKYVREIERLSAELAQLRPTEDTVICKKCGARVREDAMFCSGCGAKLG